MSAALYDIALLRLAAELADSHRLDRPDVSIERRSPVCGSRVVIDLCFDADDRIAAAGIDAHACALGQASAALLMRHIVGVDAGTIAAARDALASWLAGEAAGPGDWPGLDGLAAALPYPGRHAAIRLPFEAAASAAARRGRA